MKKTVAMISIGALILGAVTAGCGNSGQTGAGSNAEQDKPVQITATRDNGDGTSTSTVAEYPTVSEPDGTLSQGMNQFAYTMAEQITAANAGENYFFSPYSVCSALTLLDNAAGGETRAQMEEMLGISDLAQWNQQLSAYRRQEQPAEAVITDANSIWLAKDFVLKDEAYTNYLPKMEFYYDAQLYHADFAGDTEGTKEQIRAWIQENTGDMITDYKSIATPNTVLDLINAVYFYGEWSMPFAAAFTAPETFMGANGDTEVDMMHQSEVQMSYLEANGLRALSVPYGDGSKVMNIVLAAEDQAYEVTHEITGEAVDEGTNEVTDKGTDEVTDEVTDEGTDEAADDQTDEVPTEKESVSSVINQQSRVEEIFESLSVDEKNNFLNQLMNAETQMIMNFSLPKFEMTYSFTGLPEILRAMGMVDAFDAVTADFSGLGSIYVSDIGHMAKLEVDELGSRASAVTEITMDESAVMIDGEPINFIVNQPFLFFIQDQETGVILFMGQVNDLK